MIIFYIYDFNDIYGGINHFLYKTNLLTSFIEPTCLSSGSMGNKGVIVVYDSAGASL